MGAFIYGAGVVVAVIGGLLALALVFAIVGRILLAAATYMLRNGLSVIRLSNWLYWNRRMHDEGLVAMQRHYKELVAKQKPKDLADWDGVDRQTRDQDPDSEVDPPQMPRRPGPSCNAAYRSDAEDKVEQ